VLSNVVTFLSYFAVYIARTGNPWVYLNFSTFAPWQVPWTFLTYPLVTYDLFNLLFSGYWLWVVGGSLERAWSTRRFLQFFFGITLIESLGLWLGSLLLSAIGVPSGAILTGLWLPLAALTVAWCLLNPDQIVLFGFILPIKSRYLMWGTFAFTYFGFAFSYPVGPWLAFFALAGPAAAYLYSQWHSGHFLHTRKPFYLRSGGSRSELRPPNLLERAWDWLLYWWERLRRR
jgi:membrane associated rhomboid family serine protease